jgi:hypothetical protein
MVIVAVVLCHTCHDIMLTGTYRPGNNIADFKAAFRHVVYLFKGMNAPFVYQLAYNSGNPRDDRTPFSTMYPGDDVVDMVSTYILDFFYYMTFLLVFFIKYDVVGVKRYRLHKLLYDVTTTTIFQV